MQAPFCKLLFHKPSYRFSRDKSPGPRFVCLQPYTPKVRASALRVFDGGFDFPIGHLTRGPVLILPTCVTIMTIMNVDVVPMHPASCS